MGMVALTAGVLLDTAGAVLLASCLRVRSFASFGLAAYTFAWAQIVLVIYVLSLGKWVERPALIGALVVVVVAAAVVWAAFGRPVPPVAEWRAQASALAADPIIRVLGAAVILVYTYVLVLAVSTVPNDGDPLVYELTRAALWRQQHGVGWLGTAYDTRLDISPPHAELGQLSTMVLSGSDRFVATGQFMSVFALVLGAAGIGARMGLSRRDAMFGALLLPFVPVVLVQSWTGFTDLVFASFLVAATYFSLGSRRAELIPFGLAVGLALGTKFLGPLLLPLVALVVVSAQPVRRLLGFALAGVAGGVLGGVWYVGNIVNANGASGGVDRSGFQTLTWRGVFGSLNRYVTELFDLSGASGRGVLLYLLAGIGLAVVGALRHRRRRVGATLVGAGLLVATLPLWIAAGHRCLTAVSEVLWRLGRTPGLEVWFDRSTLQTKSDGALSWFGPVAATMVIATIPLAIRVVRRRELPGSALVLALAPALAMVSVSLTIIYLHYQGRYFTSAVALSASLWGLTARWGAVRVGLASASIVTAVLCLVNSLGKPTGIELLGGEARAAVWSMPRWQQQGLLRPSPPERSEIDTLRYVERAVPEDAHLGLALRENDFGFPYFGRGLERTIEVVDVGDAIASETEWLVAAPGRETRLCASQWRLAYVRGGWRIFHRVVPSRPCR